MSGIAGSIDYDAIDQAAHLRAMLAEMAHYGQDRTGIWTGSDGAAALGHLLQFNTPESPYDQQPLQRGNLVITADARLDNRDDLKRALHLGDSGDPLPDSEILLAAYQRWGTDCAAHLIGDFAFVIWDDETRRAFCARDHYGVRPLFMAHTPRQRFLFASYEWAILTQLPAQVSDEYVGRLLMAILSAGGSAAHNTRYDGISLLPPSHTAIVTPDGITLTRYWDLNSAPELHLKSDDDYIDGFRERFFQAVQARTRSLYPVAAHLSGGLDSSSVVCAARSLAPTTELHTFYTLPDHPDADERPYVQAVLDQGGLIHHQVRYRSSLPSAPETAHDGTDAAMFSTRELLPPLRQHGIRTLLTGFDGDTIIPFGLEFLYDLARMGDWAAFFHEARRFAENNQRFTTATYGSFLARYGQPVLEELIDQRRYAAYARSLTAIRQHAGISPYKTMRQRGRRWLSPPLRSLLERVRPSGAGDAAWQELNPTIQPELVQRFHLSAIAQQDQHEFRSLRESHRANAAPEHYGDSLDGYTKFYTRANVEVRHPFLDVRVVEFLLGTPGHLKFKDGWNRYIVRRAFDGIMPPRVQWRADKIHVGEDFIGTMKREDTPFMESLIYGDLSDLEAYLVPSALRTVYERFKNPSGSAVDRYMDGYVIWRAIDAIVWVRAVRQRAAAFQARQHSL